MTTEPGAALGLPTSAWMWISAGITVGLFVPCWLLELHPLTWLMAMFYGPLIASYQSRHNVVWRCALGGLVGMATVLLGAILMEWAKTKGLFSSMGGVAVPEDDEESGITLRFILGVPLLFASVFPFCLVGSSVGEHLSVWRRKREFEPPPPEPQAAPRKMTDEEIARIDL